MTFGFLYPLFFALPNSHWVILKHMLTQGLNMRQNCKQSPGTRPWTATASAPHPVTHQLVYIPLSSSQRAKMVHWQTAFVQIKQSITVIEQILICF